MKIYLKFIIAFLTGLAASHIIFSFLVYKSNSELFIKLHALANAGYLTIPNPNVVSHLLSFKNVFCGAVFFTLTAGTFLSIISLIVAFLWDNFDGKEILAVFIILTLLVTLILLNFNSICIYVSLAVLIVPLITVYTYINLYSEGFRVIDLKSFFIQVLSIVFLSVILVSIFIKSEKEIFIDFRDDFLFSNPIGRVINDFYYDYTLFPAEVIKSAQQKSLISCFIKNNDKYFKQIEFQLRKRNYLNLGNDKNIDIYFAVVGDEIQISNGDGKLIVKAEIKDFLSHTGKYLKKFSDKTDKYGAFKLLILISLLTSFPLFFYFVMHFVLFFFLSILKLKDHRYNVASFGVFMLAVVLFIILSQSSGLITKRKMSKELLNSAEASDRVAALKFISNHKKNAYHYINYYDEKNLENAGIIEKYWFANAAAGRNRKFFNTLIRLLKDEQSNVVCQAVYALGKSGNRKAVKYILDVVSKSDHWYIQWYAYNALMNLGWQQKYIPVK